MKIIYKTVPLLKINYIKFLGLKIPLSRQRSDELKKFDLDAFHKFGELMAKKRTQKYIIKFRLAVSSVYHNLSEKFLNHEVIGEVIDFEQSKI